MRTSIARARATGSLPAPRLCCALALLTLAGARSTLHALPTRNGIIELAPSAVSAAASPDPAAQGRFRVFCKKVGGAMKGMGARVGAGIRRIAAGPRPFNRNSGTSSLRGLSTRRLSDTFGSRRSSMNHGFNPLSPNPRSPTGSLRGSAVHLPRAEPPPQRQQYAQAPPHPVPPFGGPRASRGGNSRGSENYGQLPLRRTASVEGYGRLPLRRTASAGGYGQVPAAPSRASQPYGPLSNTANSRRSESPPASRTSGPSNYATKATTVSGRSLSASSRTSSSSSLSSNASSRSQYDTLPKEMRAARDFTKQSVRRNGNGEMRNTHQSAKKRTGVTSVSKENFQTKGRGKS